MKLCCYNKLFVYFYFILFFFIFIFTILKVQFLTGLSGLLVDDKTNTNF